MNFWKRHLTTRLSAYFLLVSLLTVGLVGTVAYGRAKASLKQAVFNQLSSASTLKEGEILRWFEDQQRDFLLITQFPEVQAQFKQLLQYQPTEPEYLKAKEILTRYLQGVVKVKPNLREITLQDQTRRVVAASDPSREGKFRIDADVTYFETVTLGDKFAPIFYVSPETGQLSVTFATPIRDAKGDRLGILSADLNLERIDQIIRERTGLGTTGESYLVGYVVTGNSFISQDELLPVQQRNRTNISSPGIDAAMRGNNGYGLYLNYAEVPVIGVYRWLNDRDLALLVEMSQSEAFLPARQLAAAITFIGLLSALGLSLGVYFLSKQIARPILAIAKTTTQIAAGDLNQKAPVLTQDEVGILAKNFNQMVEELKISRDQSREYSTSLELKAQELETAIQQLKKTQAQLIQTEKMSSLGQLVAGIAHEINNPVNFIYGNLKHLGNYVDDLLGLIDEYQKAYPIPVISIQSKIDEMDLGFVQEDIPQILGSIQVGANRISDIVRSLRNFSRLDQSDKKPADVHEGIDNTLVILQHRLKGKPGQVDIEIEKNYGQIPKIECYPGQLNQVFMNILSNAIDALEDQQNQGISQFKPAGFQPQILIQTQLIERSGPEHPAKVMIKIADNGMGMPLEVQEKIFDPFFTTKPVGKGTGMGLAVSYSIIVELHQGQLVCTSTPGCGAVFTIELPYVEKIAGILDYSSPSSRFK